MLFMYKLTRCVKKHNLHEPMNCHHAFLMRYSRCHVGVINTNYVTRRGHNLVYYWKYWILHPGIPKQTNMCLPYHEPFMWKVRHDQHYMVPLSDTGLHTHHIVNPAANNIFIKLTNNLEDTIYNNSLNQ